MAFRALSIIHQFGLASWSLVGRALDAAADRGVFRGILVSMSGPGFAIDRCTVELSKAVLLDNMTACGSSRSRASRGTSDELRKGFSFWFS